jgi:serine/threonine-protein kinase
MRQASRFPRGLGDRERLLISVDSLSAEDYFAWRHGLRNGSYVEEEAVVQRLIATLSAGLRRYPSDPELAFLMAEARSRTDVEIAKGEMDDRAILALYDRAIALDSAFAPAYVRPISLASYLDGAPRARRYIDAYLALQPSGPHAESIRLAGMLLDPARSAAIDVRHLVDSLSTDRLCEATALLQHIPDSTETSVRIARAVMERRASATPAGDGGAMCSLMQGVDALQFRGHLREARRAASRGAHWMHPTVLYNMSRFGMVPRDSARIEFQRILSLAPRTRLSKLYGWWASDGDTTSIKAYITQFSEAETDRPRPPSTVAALRATAAAGRAYLALAKRDTAAALRQFLTTPDTLHECWYDNRLATVRLLVAAGRQREAARRLERRWPGTSGCSNGVDDVLWTMERARMFERLGMADLAVENYAFVADAWRTADPELQPLVRESHEALARIGVSSVVEVPSARERVLARHRK